MQEWEASRGRPDIKQLVTEASRALIQLDAGRLEELALSCQALNRGLVNSDAEERVRLAGQARTARGDLAVLARILDATRSNLGVMNRLRESRAGRLEYGGGQSAGWTPTEIGHGDD